MGLFFFAPYFLYRSGRIFLWHPRFLIGKPIQKYHEKYGPEQARGDKHMYKLRKEDLNGLQIKNLDVVTERDSSDNWLYRHVGSFRDSVVIDGHEYTGHYLHLYQSRFGYNADKYQLLLS